MEGGRECGCGACMCLQGVVDRMLLGDGKMCDGCGCRLWPSLLLSFLPPCLAWCLIVLMYASLTLPVLVVSAHLVGRFALC